HHRGRWVRQHRQRRRVLRRRARPQLGLQSDLPDGAALTDAARACGSVLGGVFFFFGFCSCNVPGDPLGSLPGCCLQLGRIMTKQIAALKTLGSKTLRSKTLGSKTLGSLPTGLIAVLAATTLLALLAPAAAQD